MYLKPQAKYLSRLPIIVKRILTIVKASFCLGFIPLHATVLVSVRPLGFVVSALLENIDQVEVMVSDGHSPHTYSPSAKQMSEWKRAQAVIFIGPGLEHTLAPLIEQQCSHYLALGTLPSVHTQLRSQSVPCSLGCHHQPPAIAGSVYDWHIWLSLDLMRLCAIEVTAYLKPMYSALAQKTMEANLSAFLASLDKLETETRQGLQKLTAKNYAVFHDAYGYFTHGNGLAPAEVLTRRNTLTLSAKEFIQVCTFLQDAQVKLLLVEPTDPIGLAQRLAELLDLKVVLLDPFGLGRSLGKDSYQQFYQTFVFHWIAAFEDV